MYFQNTITEKLYITSQEFKKYKKDNINSRIRESILEKYGDKCQKYGLLIKDSIKIIERSIGMFNDGHLNSSLTMNIVFEAKVCNPPEGLIIQCTVISSNKMGILASIGEDLNKSPLIILLARQHHIDNKYFKSIKKGKQIYAVVIGKKYDLNDKQISLVAKLSNKNDFRKQNSSQNDFLNDEDEVESDEDSHSENDSNDTQEYKITESDNDNNKDDDEDDDDDDDDDDDEEEYLNMDDEDEDDNNNLIVDSEEEEEDDDI